MNSVVHAEAAQQQPMNRYLFWLGSAVFLAVLGYLAFHYARLTNFPIGDDPAIHIARIQTQSYLSLLGTTYPLPLWLFKAIQAVTNTAHPQLFVILISAYLSLAGAVMAFLLHKGYNNWLVAMAGSLFFITSRWVNDGLRMGLFAETFSWIVLFIAFYFLIRHKVIPLLIATAVLALSHPFALTMFGLTFMCYAIILLLTGTAEEKRFVYWTVGVYAAMALVILVARPDLINRFLMFGSGDPAGWGERTIWEILSSDDTRRLILPALALIGLPVAATNWQRPINRIMLILLVLGLFFSVNYEFGISFIPFRFYSYLEIAIAALAGLGLVTIVEGVVRWQWARLLVAGFMMYLFIVPNFEVNQEIGVWQATNPDAKAIMTPADRAAFGWIAANTKPTDVFAAPQRQAIWIAATANRHNQQVLAIVNDEQALQKFYANDSILETDYIYYASGQAVPPSIIQRYELVFAQNGVSLWRVRHAFSS